MITIAKIGMITENDRLYLIQIFHSKFTELRNSFLSNFVLIQLCFLFYSRGGRGTFRGVRGGRGGMHYGRHDRPVMQHQSQQQMMQQSHNSQQQLHQHQSEQYYQQQGQSSQSGYHDGNQYIQSVNRYAMFDYLNYYYYDRKLIEV